MESGHVLGVTAADQPTYCTHHQTELISFFCTDCTEAVCTKCLLLQHKGHGYEPVEEAAATGRHRLEADASLVGHHIGRHQTVIRAGEAERDVLGKRLKEAEGEIVRKADELKKLIDG